MHLADCPHLGVAGLALVGFLAATAVRAETALPASASGTSGTAVLPTRDGAALVTSSGSAGGPQRWTVAAPARRAGAGVAVAALSPRLAQTLSASTDTPLPGRRGLGDIPVEASPRPERIDAPAPPPASVSRWPEPNNYMSTVAGLGLVLWVVRRHRPT